MTFQIEALPAEPFADLFALPEAELAARNIRRMTIKPDTPGAPCRVSLAEAELGETVLLTNYQHQPANSPYQASHAIYVREGVAQERPAAGAIPAVFHSRLISVRLFDESDMMIDADVVEGPELGAHLASVFENEAVAYVHLHYAKPGCYAATVRRS